MRNFQDTFETRKRSFISGFSVCITEPLINKWFFNCDLKSKYDEWKMAMFYHIKRGKEWSR